jgi:hypothetical protein
LAPECSERTFGAGTLEASARAVAPSGSLSITSTSSGASD